MVPGEFLSKMCGQKNLDSKLSYLTNKEATHKAASLAIQRKAFGKDGTEEYKFNAVGTASNC